METCKSATPRKHVIIIRYITNGTRYASTKYRSHMIDQTITALTAPKNSKFRSRFKLTDKDRQHIQTKGIDTIRSHAIDFIKTRLAPAFPKNEGKQTPMREHIVLIAQHATATCCRKCLWKWYRIEKGRPLGDDEIGFVVALVMGWIGDQDHVT